VNTGDEPVALPRPGKLLLASAPLDGPAAAPEADDEVLLPPNTTAWWTAA
jgi:alpha-glucosidase